MIRRRPGTTPAPGGRHYRLLLLLAGLALLWERSWPRLWPACCVVGGFVSLALMDLLPHLPNWAHIAVLAAFALGLLAALVWAWPALRLVSRSEARARLERDNALTDQPLQALEDRLAAGRNDILAEALWSRHRQRMAGLVGRLRVRWPQPQMSRHEPWGVRAGVLIALVIGVVAGHADPAARLARAFDPGVGGSGQPPSVDVWITPPSYTGVAPILLSGGATKAVPDPVAFPARSTLLARVTGTSRAPALALGGKVTPFEPLGEGDGKRAWRIETVVDDGDRIIVRNGRRELAAWPIAVIADAPPRPTFDKPPAKEGNGLLKLAWRAIDDYGIVEISAVIEPAAIDEPGIATAKPPLRVPLPLAGPPGVEAAGTSLQDLSVHALAGSPVRIHLEAKDAAGQIGSSETVEVVLPEREFSHPVARHLIALRKRLTAPAPEVRTGVAIELQGIAAQPEAFDGDIVVALALAVAEARLRLDEGAAAVASVREMLWETALRIEQGDVPLAERQLEEARQRLADALQQGASADEIERLMDALQQALDHYLSTAAAELARRGQTAAPFDTKAQMLNSDDLKNMIETARELLRSGGRESAMEMLAQLQRMLDDIRSGLRSGDGRAERAEAQKMMQALHELSDRQQRLLDDSFRKLREQRAQQERGPRPSQGRQPPGIPGGTPLPAPGSPSEPPAGQRGARPEAGDKGGSGAAEQLALRKELGDLMLRLDEMLGSIPQPLAEADRAMKGALDALGQSRLGDTVSNQTAAVDALDRAMQAAGQALAQRQGGGISLGAGDGSGSDDIFGRSAGGRRGFAAGGLKLPDRSSLQRAQEILDELRRRAAERSRPVDELDYIDRLLRRF